MNSAVEQSYEELHELNANLQEFLHEMKLLEDQNRHYQEKIEDIRRNYLNQLEFHLKRLPADFRHESDLLNEAHLERYRSKSRARRFLNEREELKKRIHFLHQQDRHRLKQIERLTREDQQIKVDLKTFHLQIGQVEEILQHEKESHRQAMEKLDQLYLQFEQSCVDRSKTEFEIQTLREEVKLMQTAKEFLQEEEQSLLATQIDANEEFLSRLSQSISRLRGDFQQLHEEQMKELEEHYQQTLNKLQSKPKAIEEKASIEPIRREQQTLIELLEALNEENQRLNDQMFALESDLFALRDEHQREFEEKNQLSEEYHCELERMNEKLSHLAEYDRNLKFELTLYRGVLEGEHRRKFSSTEPFENHLSGKSPSTDENVRFSLDPPRAERKSIIPLIEINHQETISDEIDDDSPRKTMSEDLLDNEINEPIKQEDQSQMSLESTMNDLRYVFRDLANDEDFIEITDDFSSTLIDRLEFVDQQIRTVFDQFIRKYIIEPSKEQIRPKTLDWNEFREILFPMVTGRFLERHLHQLFDLFDTEKQGILSKDAILELLELLQIPNANDFSSTFNDSLSHEEFLDFVLKTPSMTEHILPNDLDSTEWYHLGPTEENVRTADQTLISDERTDVSSEKLVDAVRLLGRIFKRMGIDIDEKRLDSQKTFLTMRLTNEFIHQNIPISSDDLQRFIQMYFIEKQRTDPQITWSEFRNLFLPIVNDGLFSKEDLIRYFRILDLNQQGFLTETEVLHLFRLFQISSTEDLLQRLNEQSNWSFDDLIVLIESSEEISSHFLFDFDPTEFDEKFGLDWLKKNTI